MIWLRRHGSDHDIRLLEGQQSLQSHGRRCETLYAWARQPLSLRSAAMGKQCRKEPHSGEKMYKRSDTEVRHYHQGFALESVSRKASSRDKASLSYFMIRQKCQQ